MLKNQKRGGEMFSFEERNHEGWRTQRALPQREAKHRGVVGRDDACRRHAPAANKRFLVVFRSRGATWFSSPPVTLPGRPSLGAFALFCRRDQRARTRPRVVCPRSVARRLFSRPLHPPLVEGPSWHPLSSRPSRKSTLPPCLSMLPGRHGCAPSAHPRHRVPRAADAVAPLRPASGAFAWSVRAGPSWRRALLALGVGAPRRLAPGGFTMSPVAAACGPRSARHCGGGRLPHRPSALPLRLPRAALPRRPSGLPPAPSRRLRAAPAATPERRVAVTPAQSSVAAPARRFADAVTRRRPRDATSRHPRASPPRRPSAVSTRRPRDASWRRRRASRP